MCAAERKESYADRVGKMKGKKSEIEREDDDTVFNVR